MLPACCWKDTAPTTRPPSPNAVVDSHELRAAILDVAHTRSFTTRAGGVTQVVDMASIVRVDDRGNPEESDPEIPWTPDGATHLHMASTDSDEDSPRLRLHRAGEHRGLLLTYERSELVRRESDGYAPGALLSVRELDLVERTGMRAEPVAWSVPGVRS